MSTETSVQAVAVPAFRPSIVVDLKRCIGCNACSIACKQENNVPLGARWAEVYAAETGTYPAVEVRVLSMFCQQCGSAPCMAMCDALGHHAIVRRADGILYVDQNTCVGCQKCIPVCPFKSMFFNAETGKAQKCHMCMHRIDAGLLPACVITCLGVTREYLGQSALAAKYPQAAVMGPRGSSVLYNNMGDAPPRGNLTTAGYPNAGECH